MHLTDILQLRAVPAAGVYLALTRRCPLSCRHCLTNSLMSVPDNPTMPFLRFANTFTELSHPELVLMTGGEALLKANTVHDIAQRAAMVGTRSYALSGMYFARERRIPPAIKRAIDTLDHFAASIDAFHEEEVPRASVVRVLRELLQEGKDVSVQIVGLGENDPYLKEAIEDLRGAFDERVPLLVSTINPVGRAAEWLPRTIPTAFPPKPPAPRPCTLATWPVVRFDGKIVACTNQNVIDTKHPAKHLIVGEAAQDDWASVRERVLTRDLLRAIRLVGPEVLDDRPTGCSPGYCETCVGLSDDNAAYQKASELGANPRLPAMEAVTRAYFTSGGVVRLVRQYALPRYADLVLLGRNEGQSICAN
jgi:pyruvate-formate lyase-activating enzyme